MGEEDSSDDSDYVGSSDSDTSGESDSYDSTETVDVGPEFVCSENDQRPQSRLAFTGTPG